jgi:two-component system nitrogen regulation response regulator GlnG/two-component system response regulator HydG
VSSRASSTVGSALPWERSRSSGAADSLHLVICWSLDEPSRVGEIASVKSGAVLGRGGPQPEDDAPRLVFRRARPGSDEVTRSLESKRISRVQLRVAAEGDAIVVRNAGKTALVWNDREVASCTVREGDVFAVKNALVLAVVRRPSTLEPLRTFPRLDFPFGGPDPFGIVGESPACWSLREAIAVAARGPHHVLVQGESGVGKELVAHAIHALSDRSKRPLISRNAATFPEGLVDAELFGNVRNYPNAGSPERAGLVGEADGSTLVLDEIGELPQALQAHLLRALDRGGEYQRLGEGRPRSSSFRLVAMTNRSIDTLKHDFAARFASRLEVPTLGERIEDIPLLVRHLALDAAKKSPEVAGRFVEGGEPRVDPRLIAALIRHPWTLHLRELSRLLWSAIAASKGEFIELVPEVARELDTPKQERGEPTEAEVRAALDAHEGNVTRAAKQLGLESRYVLYRLMKKLGINRPE